MGQILGYGQRPHHEARLQRLQGLPGASQQLTDRDVASRLGHFAVDQHGLGVISRLWTVVAHGDLFRGRQG